MIFNEIYRSNDIIFMKNSEIPSLIYYKEKKIQPSGTLVFEIGFECTRVAIPVYYM